MASQPFQLHTRAEKLRFKECWNALWPVERMTRAFGCKPSAVSAMVQKLRREGYELVDRSEVRPVKSVRRASRAAKQAPLATPSRSGLVPVARVERTETAGFVVKAGIGRWPGQISRSPANLIAAKIRSALSTPPIADVIITDASGRPVKRLDGLTKREKPL